MKCNINNCETCQLETCELYESKWIKKEKSMHKQGEEQYDEALKEAERLLDNLQALHTNIVNASETDGITQKDMDELDWMNLTVNLTVGSVMQAVEEFAQTMER